MVAAIKKKKRTYTLADLTREDFNLLKQSYFLAQNEPTAFLCFGMSYYKLKALDLIDDENQITYNGKIFVKEYLAKFEEQ